MDCIVLKLGLNRFNNQLKEINDILNKKFDENNNYDEVYDKLTISSLADNIVKKYGAYTNCYEVSGVLRDYLASSVYGGRVHVNSKFVKCPIEGKIMSFDGVSLYPSAMYRICRDIGIPTGKAYVIEDKELKNKKWIKKEKWRKYKHAIFTVKINKVNKFQNMPIIAHKMENGIEYLNVAPVEPVVIDKITLEDYIEGHEIEYEILAGVYWKTTSNKLGEIVKVLFEKRLEAKNKRNITASDVLKLMLNSIFGKTLTKKVYKNNKIVKADVLNTHIYNYYNSIDYCYKVNKNDYVVIHDSIDTSYNLVHIGGMILSMARRIMNEIFFICNDNNIDVFYTDTDSIHMNQEDIKELSRLYKNKYNKELVGDFLEQFNEDLEIDGCKNVYASKSIFLGKKSYIDVLVGEDIKTGEIKEKNHCRMKGITKEGLDDIVKRKYKNHYDLYHHLALGEEVDIILNPFDKENNKQKVQFEFGKSGGVRTKDEFIRKVKF